MATIIFYEKPGCINNTKQKILLEEAGHKVEAKNLLETPWTQETLKTFFQDLPVTDWFNVSAPAIKTGEINPSQLSNKAALALMINNPILIRRPLMEIEGKKMVGFNPEKVNDWLAVKPTGEDLELCPQKGNKCESQ